jgi:hypothetical protein
MSADDGIPWVIMVEHKRSSRTSPPAGLIAPASPTPPQISTGMGDWIWSWAHPLGAWLDRRAAPRLQRWGLWKPGFRLAGCGGCSWRRSLYNILLPDLRSWAAWRAFPRHLWRHLRSGGSLLKAPRSAPTQRN